jgi:F-type H+-transporting ATPase subunit a
MSPTRRNVLVGLGLWLGGTVVIYVVFGKGQKHPNYAPQDEFKLHTYVNLGILSITQAVIYVFLAGILTCATVIYVARRMKQRPNRVQTLVEVIFHGLQTNIVGANMDRRMAARWFPFVATLALFIFYSNVVGYLPLPTNTSEYVSIFGWHIPPFSLYAATANLSIPLVLAIVVFVSYTVEGVRAKGPIGYLKGLIPAGVIGPITGVIFVLEVLSNLMRVLSLSIRLFANILAGHLIILFMAGALSVLLGIAAIGWFTLPFGVIVFMFELGLVAALQGFIFATLTAIYLGGAVAESH